MSISICHSTLQTALGHQTGFFFPQQKTPWTIKTIKVSSLAIRQEPVENMRTIAIRNNWRSEVFRCFKKHISQKHVRQIQPFHLSFYILRQEMQRCNCNGLAYNPPQWGWQKGNWPAVTGRKQRIWGGGTHHLSTWEVKQRWLIFSLRSTWAMKQGPCQFRPHNETLSNRERGRQAERGRGIDN